MTGKRMSLDETKTALRQEWLSMVLISFIFLAMELIFVVIIGGLVMLLWNYFVTEITSLQRITFGIAMYLVVILEVLVDSYFFERIPKKKVEGPEYLIAENGGRHLAKTILTLLIICLTPFLWNNIFPHILNMQIGKITILYVLAFYIFARGIILIINEMLKLRNIRKNEQNRSE